MTSTNSIRFPGVPEHVVASAAPNLTAVFQAHHLVVALAARLLRDASKSIRGGYSSTAEARLDAARRLLALTRRLYEVRHPAHFPEVAAQVDTSAGWTQWRELLTSLAREANRRGGDPDWAAVRKLTFRMLLVDWDHWSTRTRELPHLTPARIATACHLLGGAS